jgi:hypothetical protein
MDELTLNRYGLGLFILTFLLLLLLRARHSDWRCCVEIRAVQELFDFSFHGFSRYVTLCCILIKKVTPRASGLC